MKNFFIKIILIFLIGAIFDFCENQNFTRFDYQLNSQNLPEKKTQIVFSKKWNDFKDFLIGNTKEIQNSNLQEFTTKDWYKSYLTKINQYIANYDKRKAQIENWHKENLKETYQVKNAFYLLSGADYFYFRLFYPEAENYFMFAMEKTGLFSDYKDISEKDFKNSLIAIENVIHNLSHNTYLFSKTMNQFLNQDKNYVIYGTFPIIIFFIGYFKGNIIDLKEECLQFSKEVCLVSGYSIQYQEKEKIKNIYYFSKKLVPQDGVENSPFDSLIKKFDNKGLFMKASIYLFHYQGYYKLADYILKNFEYIIQEDSGIPYRFIKQNNFKVRLYGRYIDTPKLTGQISPFQKDLSLDFAKNSEKLPFHFGYGTARTSGLSNLIFAYKNNL